MAISNQPQSSDDVTVTIQHVHSVGMCSSGARKFCKENNIDWSEFIKNGLPASYLKQMNNALINQVVKAAENGR